MKRYTITVVPNVIESGELYIPDGVNIADYVCEHFNDIELNEDTHDYDDAPVTVIDSETGNVVAEING
jgi:hypothetical protein